MEKLSYVDMVEKVHIAKNHVVELFSYEKWKEIADSGSLDFAEAKLISTKPENIERDGFLYPTLSKYDVQFITFGKVLVLVMLLGNPADLQREIMEAIKGRETIMLGYATDDDNAGQLFVY